MKVKKNWFCLLLVSLILTFSCQPPARAQGQPDHDKVLVLIIDYIDIGDLLQAGAPNLQSLAEQSGIGLMNIRAKNRYGASGYMSMAAGSRVAANPGSEWSFNSSEAVEKLPEVYASTANNFPTAGQLYNLFTGYLAPPKGVVNLSMVLSGKYAASFSPPYQLGQLGSWAKENNLQVGVMGNADIVNSLDRSVTILAMDDKGIVPRGDVSQGLLKKDPKSLGGLCNNSEAYMACFNSLWSESNILFADLGDSSRVERSRDNCSPAMLALHRRQAIENEDIILGQIIKKVDLSHTLLFILTPNTNQDMLLAGNFGLTPVMVHFPDGEKGFLTSPTTRRTGLVTNLDLLPTIKGFFSSHLLNPSGMISIVADSRSSLTTVNDQLALFLRLRQSRDPFHYTFILILAALLITAYFYHVRNKRRLGVLFRVLMSGSLIIPFIFLFISLTGYSSLISCISWSILISILAGFLCTFLIKSPGMRLGLICALTAMALLVDGFRGAPLMLLSPLGSDAIAGGRFYGIGNDYMGIILGSTTVAVLMGLNRLKLSATVKAGLGLFPLAAAALVIGHPQFGANMGGLITALAVMALFVLTVKDCRVGFKQYAAILILAFLAVLAVAYLDARFSSVPSHAGKTISSFSSEGLLLVWGMLQSKIGILAGTVAHTPWTLILVGGVLLWFFMRPLLLSSRARLQEIFPAALQGFNILGLGTLTVFLVNDTGIIAAAFMFIYGLACLWAGLEQMERKPVN